MKIRALFMASAIACLSFYFISPVQAEDEDGPLSHWFLGLGAGVVSPLINHRINFANSGMPGFPDDKYVTNDWTRSPSFSLTGGYQWQFANDWLTAISLGLEYNYSQPQLKGDIYVNALDDAKNFRYQYTIKQQLIQLKLKLNLFTWYEFMPFLSLGAGAAINDVDNYSESPISGATSFDKRYAFTAATTTQFASSIGIGVDYWFKENMAMTAGYYYTSTGNVRTGPGEGVLSGNHLTNKLALNSLELQVLYFF